MQPDGSYKLENLRLVRESVYYRYNKVILGLDVSDPLKVFVKQEPHKASKLQDGRYRLIMSVSLVDALIDRILFMKLMHKVVRNFHNTRIMIGWSPVQGGYRLIDEFFGDSPTISIDKKAWDWTVPVWLLMAVKNVIKRLAVDPPDWWCKAVDSRFAALFINPTFVFPDFTKGKQPSPGVMKSGCYLTIFINSVAQMILHYLAVSNLGLPIESLDDFIFMGDDSLQKLFPQYPEYIKYLESLGFTMEYEIHEDRSEFAGFTYKLDYKPAYRDKHLFMLSYLTFDREVAVSTLMNYQLLYYFDKPFLKLIRDIIKFLGYSEAYIGDDSLRALAVG